MGVAIKSNKSDISFPQLGLIIGSEPVEVSQQIADELVKGCRYIEYAKEKPKKTAKKKELKTDVSIPKNIGSFKKY